MATRSPQQHDTEGRSATILPGVPMPEWALPAGPIAPEPEPAAQQEPPVPEPAAQPAPELVLAGAPSGLLPAEPAAASEPAAEPTALSYAAALAVGANGPGPMRAGWDYPGSDLRELAHTEAEADAAEAADLETAGAFSLATGHEPGAADPVLAAALTAPIPVLEPLPTAGPSDAPADDPTAIVDTEPAPEPPAAADVLPPAEGDSPVAAAEDVDADGDVSSRRNLVALGALGAVLILGAVAAFVWPGLLVSQEPEPVPVVPSAAAPAAPVTLTAPDAVGPYTKLTGPPATALAAAVSGTALPGLSVPVSAVYGTGTTPAVTVAAWSSASPAGASSIPTAYAAFLGATSTAVTGITSTPVSDAGEMRCGTTVVQGAPASLCLWADEATFGAVTVLKPSSPESAADTAVAVRAAVLGG